MSRARKQILIADDNPSMRRILAELLSRRTDWELCAEATDGRQAVEFARTFCPDVAILDIQMPHINGIEAARLILRHCPNTIIVSDSSHDAELFFEEIKAIGIKGFVSKDRLGTDLLPTVEAVLKGQVCFPLLLPETG
jgi:DNA-binding NarL/FixJ family response regulator